MRRRASKYALCPFYSAEADQKIYCEGVQDGTSIHLAFGSKTDRKTYEKEYCCADYIGCKICRMLYEKYEERDG